MKNKNLRIFLLIAFVSCFYSMDVKAETGSLIVNTKQGKLRGMVNGDSVCVWKGIRYAQAPVGNLRFRAPLPPKTWEGIKEAADFGNIPPQMKRALHEKQVQSEDCLFLNIWSPAADGKKRPVMFWIHGGGFIAGCGSGVLYDGTHLVKNGDVVVVTINYRLGPLGWLYFKDIDSGKNGLENDLGMRDQIAALQWVKDNIAAFGGDPANVTIFGESAGAISVLTLMGIPSAKNLFTKAIAESGAPEVLWQPKAATEITKRYLAILGVPPDSLFKLRTLPVDTIESAMEKLMRIMIKEPGLGKTFAPTIDGDLIPEDLMAAESANKISDIPLLIGTNKNEANLFAIHRLQMVPVSAKKLAPYLVRMNPDARDHLFGAYKDYPHRSGVLEIITDAVFTVPSIQFAEAQSAKAPTYMYRFDWSSGLLKLVGLKAFHGLEVPFVFGTLNNSLVKKIAIAANKKTMRKLSKQMQQAWINFAYSGNPNKKGQDQWQTYSPAVRNTLVFDKNVHPLCDPCSEQRKAWSGLSIF